MSISSFMGLSLGYTEGRLTAPLSPLSWESGAVTSGTRARGYFLSYAARITFSPMGKRRLGQQDSRRFQALRAHPHLNDVLLHCLPEVSRLPVIRALTVPTAVYRAQQRSAPHLARHADIFSIPGNWVYLTARLRVFLGWRQSQKRQWLECA